MGMFNEVYKRCPRCEQKVYHQISQVVLGFGNFDLDNVESTKDLTPDEKDHLKRVLVDEVFNCECGHSFTLEVHIKGPDHTRVEI